MKALRWHGRGDIRYESVPEPHPGSQQVKAKIYWTGICGTDWHEYKFGPIFIPLEPHPLTGTMAPLILGHEFSGVVVEVGDEVSEFRPGDRVTADCIWCCGECFFCKRNMPNLCVKVAFTGHHCDGSMAEYLVAPAYSFYKLPDSISDEVGVLTEPLAVAIHAVRKSKLQIGDTVAILGAGTIGLSTFLAARVSGASKIYVLEISELRRERAQVMGATAVIDPEFSCPVEQIRDLTSGLGADVSFDCVGLPNTAPLAIELARKGGTAVIVGIPPAASPDFNFYSIFSTEKTVVGATGYVRDTETAIDLIADGRIDPSGFITGRVSMKDAVDKGFKEIINNPDKHLKILIKCSY